MKVRHGDEVNVLDVPNDEDEWSGMLCWGGSALESMPTADALLSANNVKTTFEKALMKWCNEFGWQMTCLSAKVHMSKIHMWRFNKDSN